MLCTYSVSLPCLIIPSLFPHVTVLPFLTPSHPSLCPWTTRLGSPACIHAAVVCMCEVGEGLDAPNVYASGLHLRFKLIGLVIQFPLHRPNVDSATNCSLLCRCLALTFVVVNHLKSNLLWYLHIIVLANLPLLCLKYIRHLV